MDNLVVDQKLTDDFAFYNADTCTAIKNIPSDSIGYSIYSPPFRGLYCYSNLSQDLGNSTNEQFDLHHDFIAPELFRITKPGRLCSFHCMTMPTSKTRDGVIGLSDFRGQLISAMEKHGWIFHSEVCIWKDPVTAMQRTKAMGLLHKQIRKDSAMSRQGIADYLVTMRKPGLNADPISREYGFTEYMGTEPPNCDLDIWSNGLKGKRSRPKGYRDIQPVDGKWPKQNPFAAGSDAAVTWSIAVWQRYASPVWMDIDPRNTLQSMRDENDIRHICPLQLDVVSRGIHLWSNPGDTIFTPFGGIATELYEAVRLKRKAIGIELKSAYFERGLKNMELLRAEMAERYLF